MLKSSFNEHALANARSVRCDIKPAVDTFTQRTVTLRRAQDLRLREV